LVGSTIGDAEIVQRARRRHPQLLTLDELSAVGVDGFVTMVGFSEECIRRFSPNHLVIPASMTLREAIEQSAAGAHFTKLLGPDLSLTRLCTSSGAYGFSPVFLTGGMTPERLPDAFAAGVTVTGAGFETFLSGQSAKLNPKEAGAVLRRCVEIARRAQKQKWPGPANLENADMQAWLDGLPHNHPW
jgi:2-keto-3-deoxy-6-phosphogluconate aldolase